MFSGSTALDLKVPRALEVPAPVFLRVEKVVLMCLWSMGGVSHLSKVFNKSEI